MTLLHHRLVSTARVSLLEDEFSIELENGSTSIQDFGSLNPLLDIQKSTRILLENLSNFDQMDFH